MRSCLLFLWLVVGCASAPKPRLSAPVIADQDPIIALAAYRDKRVVVEGTVLARELSRASSVKVSHNRLLSESVGRTVAEPVVAVVLEPAGRIQCFLWKGDLEPAKHIKKGMKIELECTFRDYHDLPQGRSAVLNDCSVLK